MCSGCAEVERLRRLLTYWLEVEAAMTDGPTFHRLVANFSRLVKLELEPVGHPRLELEANDTTEGGK